MKRAFTLIELMVVVGIMAFLGLAATNGYNALRRGVAERGAVDAASAVLRAAKERARVDGCVTAVFCYNICLRKADEDNNAIVAGEAVAIRRAGRITRVSGAKLYDEFGDLDNSYGGENSEGELTRGKGMRLYRVDDTEFSAMRYSVVAPVAFEDKDIGGTWSFMPWGDRLDGDSGSPSSNLVIRACAFYNLGGSPFEPDSWRVGHGYGFEFQRIRLPDGFVFGTSIPSTTGAMSTPEVKYFRGGRSDDRQIDVYSCWTDASGVPRADRKAGTASSKETAAK